MSGSHQFYTVTGRALPLPPKRTPSRHSSVLRLPTRRAEEERSTTVRADSPGRIEAPRGGEFHNIPESQRAASQLVVFDGRAQKAASSQASSVAHVSRRSSTVAAGRPAVVPSTSSKPSSVVAAATKATGGGDGGRSPPPSAPPVPSSRSASTAASSQYHAAGRDGAQRWAVASEDASGSTTPKARPAAAAVLIDTSSNSDSPCLNRMKSVENDEAAAWPTVRSEAGSAVQSIPMSSARQSRAPEASVRSQREEGYHHRHYDAHNGSSNRRNSVDSRSVTSQSQRSQHHHHSRVPPNNRPTPREGDVRPPQLQQRRPTQPPPPPPPPMQPAEAAETRAAAPSQRSGFSSYHTGTPSRGYSESEASSRRLTASEKSGLKQARGKYAKNNSNPAKNTQHTSSNTFDHGGTPEVVVPVVVSPIVPRTNNNTISTNPSNSYAQRHNTSSMSNSNMRRTPVDRQDHLYSQQKIEEHRASRPAAADAPADTSYRPLAGSQALALVPAPAVVKYSTRSPRGEEDPLEMNTPIADRVRQRSVVSANRITAATAATPATSPFVVGTLEGTELMPSLPRLQGRRRSHTDEDDRAYHTIVRFIEYQPVAERPALEAMLRDFNGREDDLCEMLTETYGEDFEMLKSACHRGPSVLLVADRPNTSSVAASQQSHASHDHASRLLLLGGGTAALRAEEGSGSSEADRHSPRQREQQEAADASYEEEVEEEAEEMEETSLAAVGHDDAYEESARPNSTPRVEEGDYDEEPVYDEDNYAREMLTPALPYERH